MRYFFAIATLALAAVLIVLGIGQRTFLAGPSSVSAEVQTADNSRFAVVSSDELKQTVGKPSITANGDAAVFMAYGRTADVDAWLKPVTHDVLSVNPSDNSVEPKTVKANESGYADLIVTGTVLDTAQTDATAPADATAPSTETKLADSDPRGSDLWLAEYSDSKTLNTAADLPEGVSMIIAAPEAGDSLTEVSITWQRDRATPLAGPLLVGGLILGVIGAILYLLAVDHDRRKTRPRRGNNKALAGLRRQSALTGVSPKSIERDRRKALGAGNGPTTSVKMVAIPVILTSTLLVSGCSADYWPDWDAIAEKPSATATPSSGPEAEIIPPAVTDGQLELIMGRVADVTKESDTTLDLELAQSRFAGPALDERAANYAIRATLPSVAAPGLITNSLRGYELPQSTKTWPRTIFTVVEDGESAQEATPTESAAPAEGETPAPTETAAANPPLGVVLVQQTPHDNYMVNYSVDIIGGAEFPEASPASVGTTRLSPDFKALSMRPKDIATAYADVLNQGSSSEFYGAFDTVDDALIAEIGQQWRTERKDALAEKAEQGSASFETVPGSGEVVALSTAQQGAIVAISILDTETILPSNERASAKFPGAPNAGSVLAGITESKTGLYQTWEVQLLFNVPATDSGEPITLLGFTHSLVKAGAK
ncbi:DUF2062 domain-containing protein [Lysinibacter cavernae]|uniref:Glycosyl transferase n=1 Tax=Lysinibacter cavernae TaxID=1640652 RepID=A0A7X5QYS8_9MICO|nr:DUF2062 domain-containing protein [Lysinibacter cavernae]NIH52436.1 hypothetical protein [Lysinibacter cavernae]